MDDLKTIDLKAIIESLLFVADKPMSVEKLAEIIEEADTKAIRAALEALLEAFNNPGRGFRLHEVAGGYQFRTHPECQAYIRRMLKPAPSRLSRAALETLAIIAYKQPIIRSDIEHIRGVDSGGVLRVLMEKKLVRVLGRREIPGRPLIYATTKHFLEVFDLKNLRDLPTPKEIEELTAQEVGPEAESEEDSQFTTPPEAPATTVVDGKHAEVLTLADGQDDGPERQAPEASVPVAERPESSAPVKIDTVESGTVATDDTPEEASEEASDKVSNEAPDEASDKVSDPASDEAPNGAPNGVTDGALDQDSLNQEEAGKTVGDNGETAV